MSAKPLANADTTEIFAGHSTADKNLAKLIISFSSRYAEASITDERKECFQAYAEEMKRYTSKHGLPSPEFMEKIFNQIYPGKSLFWYSGELEILTTKRFFTQAMWSKICDAIREDRPIVEIGPGQSFMLFYAALFGATVVGIESPADSYYKPPILDIDGMAPDPLKPELGSLQIYIIPEELLITATYDDVKNEKEKLDARDSDDDDEIDSDNELLTHERFTDELEGPDDTPMPDDQIEALSLALEAQFLQTTYPGGSTKKYIYTALSNQSAIAIVEAVKKLLPGGDLRRAQVLGVMLPPSVFGIGYILNRIGDNGAQLAREDNHPVFTIWGLGNNTFGSYTAISPTPNFYKTLTTGVSAIDPNQAITKEEHAFALTASKEKKRNKKLSPADKQRMKDIWDKQAVYGIRGHNLEKIKATQVELDLDNNSPQSMRFLPPETWGSSKYGPDTDHSFEPEEFSAIYKKTLEKGRAKAKSSISATANSILNKKRDSPYSDNDNVAAPAKKK